jgi:hypothetical protein
LKNKSNRNSGTSNNDGQGHRTFNSNDDALTVIAMKIIFQVTCGFLIVELAEGLTENKEVDESIKIGYGNGNNFNDKNLR